MIIGLLQKAGEARNTNIEAEGLEKIQLAVMASRDENGIDTASLAKNLSEISGLTDTDNNSIREDTNITLPTVIILNNTQYKIKEEGNVEKIECVKNGYLKNGLILYLDGVDNTRNGHSTTTTTWEDLSGNNNDFTKHESAANTLWRDNSYVGDETNRTLILNKAILENSSACSIEVCYDIPKLKAYYWVFQSREVEDNANGFQFWVNSNSRDLLLWGNNSYISFINERGTNLTNLRKRTMAIAVDNSTLVFSDNGEIYNKDSNEGIIQSLMPRDYYAIGSALPWKTETQWAKYWFNGNIYSIRVYNRKLSEEELRNNYEIDRVRFNMD